MAVCLADLVNCSVCFERFTQPKELPCQHTFCLNCLRGIAKDAKTIDCPQCRTRHVIPPEGVKGLRDSLLMNNLLGIVKESVPCFDCERELSLSKCEHCKENVCTDCLLAHAKLLSKIESYFDRAEEASSNIDIQSADCKHMLHTIADEKLGLQTVLKDVIRNISTRSDEIFAALAELENMIQLIFDPSMLADLRLELSNCKTKNELDEMKERLEIMTHLRGLVVNDASQSCFKLVYNLPTIDLLAQIQYGDTVLETTSSDSARSEGIPDTSTEPIPVVLGKQFKGKSAFPLNIGRNVAPKIDQHLGLSDIDYQAKKNNHIAFYQGNEAQVPSWVVYFPAFDSIYCMFEKSLMAYRLDGYDWEVVSDLNPRHIAVSDSGKLALAEGTMVTIVNLKADMKMYEKKGLWVDRLVKVHFEDATQILSFREEFVILDSGRNSLMKFNEDGNFIREFGVDKLRIDGNNKMCVDPNGRIHITAECCERIESKDYHCLNCNRPRSVNVTVKVMIVVVSWEGAFVEEIEIDRRSADIYECRRNENSDEEDEEGKDPENYLKKLYSDDNCRIMSPHDELRFIRDLSPNLIGGICVDASGFISITRTGKHQIFVYNPKRELHCTIGDPVKRPGEFKSPTGLSLMPDGRMIICDTENKRITII